MQSLVIFAAVVALGFAPWVVARALRQDREEPLLPEVMNAPEAYARHLYGEAHGWATFAMRNYDESFDAREPWEQVAAERIEAYSQA